MNLQKRKLKELKHAEYNPRKDLTPDDEEFQRIQASIETWGYVEPIVINSDNTIVGGHQRAKVLEQIGWEEADVVVVDLDKTNEKALNVALNKLSGEWDLIKLDSLMRELQESNFDTELTGFDEIEIENLNRELDNIDYLMNDNFARREEGEKDTFEASFAIPIEHREAFEMFLKEQGKEELVKMMIERVLEYAESRNASSVM